MWTIMVKDWRENWLTYLVFLVGTITLVGIIIRCFQRNVEGTYFFIFSVIVFSCFVALVGANLVAGEKARRTLPFLLALPGRRASVWLAKFLSGLAVTAVVGLIIFCFISIIDPEKSVQHLSRVDLDIYFTALLALYCMGYFFSVVFERVLTALVVALLVWAGLVNGILELFLNYNVNPALCNLVLVMAFSAGSLYIFSKGDLIDRNQLSKTVLKGAGVALLLAAACLGVAVAGSAAGSDPGDIYTVAYGGGNDKVRGTVMGLRFRVKPSVFDIAGLSQYLGEDVRLCLVDLEKKQSVMVPQRFIRYFEISPCGRWVFLSSINSRWNLPATQVVQCDTSEESSIRTVADHYRCYLYDRRRGKMIPLLIDGRETLPEDIWRIRCYWNRQGDRFAVVAASGYSIKEHSLMNIFTPGCSKPDTTFAAAGSSFRFDSELLSYGDTLRPAAAWSVDGRRLYLASGDFEHGLEIVAFDGHGTPATRPLKESMNSDESGESIFFIGDRALILMNTDQVARCESHVLVLHLGSGEIKRFAVPRSINDDLRHTTTRCMQFNSGTELTLLKRRVEVGEKPGSRFFSLHLVRYDLPAGERKVLATLDDRGLVTPVPGRDGCILMERLEPPEVTIYRVSYREGTIETLRTVRSFSLWDNFTIPMAGEKMYYFDPLPDFRLLTYDPVNDRHACAYRFPPARRSPEMLKRTKEFRARHIK